ncbi:MAG: hypothetical protein HY266_01150 [Deltaproteobacteria bacterium]|nr:hypothetical protein [Deltaproteobacteria bacterium]
MKTKVNIAASERGYLFEIPILVIFAAVTASLLLPLVGRPWNLVLIAIFLAAVVGFLVYNFFFAGWLPGKRNRR